MPDDEEYDSGNAKHIKNRKQQEKNAENLRVEDIKFLMSQPQFRRFMWHFLTFTNMNSVPPPEASQRQAGFGDGQRNVGLKYFAEVQEHCPEKYSEMVKQMKEKRQSYD